MRPFIPAKDLAYFEHFVEHVDVAESHMNTAQSSRSFQWVMTTVTARNVKLAATLRGSRPGGAIRIAHYDVIDDVITRKL